MTMPPLPSTSPLLRTLVGVPILADAADEFGVEWPLPDDRVHSPNEKFDLDALHKGARTAAVLYDRLAKL